MTSLNALTIIVKSCQRDKAAGFHDAIRFTWGKDMRALGADLKFVMGGPGSYDRISDEVTLVDCPDDYAGLPEKTHRICNWAYLKRVGYIFLCDTDTLINAAKFDLPYEDYDYSGGFKGGQAEVGKQFHYGDIYIKDPQLLWPWASGGYGYFLSPRAQAAVAATPPMVWAEDMYVGQVIGPTDLKIGALPITRVTMHLPKQNWSPDIIKRAYRGLL